MINNEKYKRQIMFHGFGESNQKKLQRSKVCIIGSGALGSIVANSLCRSGVGFLRIIDRDIVETVNLQRQILFTEKDVSEKLPKSIAACDHLKEFNSEITLEPVVTDVNSSNIENYIRDMDLVIDGTDNFETRFLINEACHKNNIKWIYGGAVASGGATMNILYGDRPCFRCFMPEMPEPGSYETCSTAGALSSITEIIASYEANEAIKILIGAENEISEDYFAIDVWDNIIDHIEVEKNPDCPVCAKAEYGLLNKPATSYSTSICGHDSWQIVPEKPYKLDLKKLGDFLKKTGHVKVTKFILNFDDGKIKFKLFPDGRAIIDGVADAASARSIYSDYIGI